MFLFLFKQWAFEGEMQNSFIMHCIDHATMLYILACVHSRFIINFFLLISHLRLSLFLPLTWHAKKLFAHLLLQKLFQHWKFSSASPCELSCTPLTRGVKTRKFLILHILNADTLLENMKSFIYERNDWNLIKILHEHFDAREKFSCLIIKFSRAFTRVLRNDVWKSAKIENLCKRIKFCNTWRLKLEVKKLLFDEFN